MKSQSSLKKLFLIIKLVTGHNRSLKIAIKKIDLGKNISNNIII